MYCKNCGTPIQNKDKFCAKCGKALKEEMRISNVSAEKSCKENLKNMKLLTEKSQRRLAAAGVIIILSVLLIIFLTRITGSVDKSVWSVKADSITTSEEVFLDGNYGQLQAITILENSGVSINAISYKEGSSFPVLQSLECGVVYKEQDSGGVTSPDAADFPALKNVSMTLENKYIDETVMETCRIFQQMYQNGQLQCFDVKIIQSIEDLYGTWADEEQTISFTFKKNGTIGISGSDNSIGNLVGADLLKFTELDDNTLSISADTSYLVDKVTFTVKYQVFGNLLYLNFAGQEITLTKQE